MLFAICAFSATAAHAVSAIQDTEIEAVVYELIEPLAKAAGIADGRLRVHILNDDDFNAFVMGGEDVYVYTGLVSRVENPLAFQAVIAHELGHMTGGHVVQMSARARAEMTRSLIIQALGVGLMVAGGNPNLGMGVMAGAGGVANSSMMAFSRDEERLADNAGIELMVKAGLDPNGLVLVMKQMQEMMGAAEARANPNRINHPFTSERLKNIREKIAAMQKKNPTQDSVSGKAANGIYPAPQAGQEQYSLIRAKIIGYLSTADYTSNIFPSKDKSDPAIYARAIAAMRAGNLGAAKTGTLALIARAPKNPFFYELLGDIEFQYGHYDDSAKAYEAALDKIEEAPQIQTALALVLAERNKPGDADRAVEMCKRALLVQPAPLTYWVLGKAELVRGNAGVADWAMAEFYSMTKDKDKAREYAKRARNNLPKDSPEYIKAGELL